MLVRLAQVGEIEIRWSGCSGDCGAPQRGNCGSCLIQRRRLAVTFGKYHIIHSTCMHGMQGLLTKSGNLQHTQINGNLAVRVGEKWLRASMLLPGLVSL